MKLIWLALISLALSGCTVRDQVAESSKEKTIHCKDSRDGEQFSFHGSTVVNVRIGYMGADTCMDVTDGDGRKRHLCKSQETYLKCLPS